MTSKFRSGQQVESVSKNQAARLFSVSLLVLFAEVACIRWFGVELLVMRVFPNLTLTAILIGFSIGLATSKEQLPKTSVILFSVLSTFACLALSDLLHINRLNLGTTHGILISLSLIGLLVVNLTMIFVSLGRVLGREFASIPALKAYGINLAGSIVGVLLFALISFTYSPPAVWIVIITALTRFLCSKKYILPLGLVLALLAAAVDKDVTWSPYGKIKIGSYATDNWTAEGPLPADPYGQDKGGESDYFLLINGEFFHSGKHFDTVKESTSILELPYVHEPHPANVLILGSGSGNDVRYALLHDAKHVDAVEINPFIAKCGVERHPDRPYRDPRVHVAVEDARSFLRYSKNKYDLIQFAYLDPGHILRMSSFLRSDNFVYTVESLKSALSLLNPNGVVSLTFATGGNEGATRRLYKTITDANGSPPISYVQDPTPRQWGSCLFLFGPGAKAVDPAIIKGMNLRPWPERPGEAPDSHAATDDWPFLYLEYSTAAIVLYIFVLISSAALPVLLFRKSLTFNVKPLEFLPMFFLGLAFMLMETKAITKLSLLFGATWIVSSVVILTILCLAVFANWIADRFGVKRTFPAYLGLTIMLLVDYLVQVPTTSSIPPLLISFSFALITCAPVFFGGMIFSTLLNKTDKPVTLMSANVLGVAMGGLMENLCVVTGIKSLSLIALVLYLCSGLPLLYSHFQPKSETPS